MSPYERESWGNARRHGLQSRAERRPHRPSGEGALGTVSAQWSTPPWNVAPNQRWPRSLGLVVGKPRGGGAYVSVHLSSGPCGTAWR